MIRLFIADPDPLVRQLLTLSLPFLPGDCAVVGEAADGEEALALLRQCRPDLLLMELSLPGIEGLALLRRLREEGIRLQTIILTRDSSFLSVRGALRLGAADYLLKPVNGPELRDAIDHLLPRFSAPIEAAPAALPPDTANRHVREAIRYIADHYTDPDISVGSVAQALEISDGYLSHLFKAGTGNTLNHYLTRCRVLAAMKLLGDTNCKVSEVAMRVGYRDAAYFSSIFRRTVGLSPSEYQNRCRGT